MIASLIAIVLLSSPATNRCPCPAIIQPDAAQLQTHIPRDKLPPAVRAAIAALDTACRSQSGKPGKSPDLVKVADLNGDGRWDFVVDVNHYECQGGASTIGHGPSGAPLTIYAGGPHKSAIPIFAMPVHASRILPAGGHAVLTLTDVADCGKSNAANVLNSRWEWCRRLLYWRPAKQSFDLTERPWPAGVAATPFMRKNYAEAAPILIAGVELGDPTSMYLLAGMYADGEGVQQDRAKAIALWRQAAEAEDRRDAGGFTGTAKFQLERIYQFGLYGVNRDEAEATYWRRRRAEVLAKRNIQP